MLRALRMSDQPLKFESFLCEQVTSLLVIGTRVLGPGDSEMKKRCGLMELVSATKGDDSVNVGSLGTFYFISDLGSLSEVT